jgi:hypothetical protein
VSDNNDDGICQTPKDAELLARAKMWQSVTAAVQELQAFMKVARAEWDQDKRLRNQQRSGRT